MHSVVLRELDRMLRRKLFTALMVFAAELLVPLRTAATAIPDIQSSEAEDSWRAFQAKAAARFGDAGACATAFLVAHHPQRDDSIDSELLLESLQYALSA